MHIGQVIRSLREEKEWSQERLALECDIATSYVSRIERGERRLPTTVLGKLAVALGTTPAEIYAIAEGRQASPRPPAEAGDVTADYSPEAVQLRRVFRDLTVDERRLLVDFAKLLVRRRA